MSINDLIDATVRCVLCHKSPKECACYFKCPVCGWLYEKGTACQNAAQQEHVDAEGSGLHCSCLKPHAARLVCATKRPHPIKTPCKCYCHAKKFRHLEGVAK